MWTFRRLFDGWEDLCVSAAFLCLEGMFLNLSQIREMLGHVGSSTMMEIGQDMLLVFLVLERPV
jgi:hypothetical protein